MEFDHFFYLLDKDSSKLLSSTMLNSDYSYLIWRPRKLSFQLSGVPTKDIIIWQLFHLARIFKNRDFAVFIIKDNHSTVHRSLIFPKYFRYPFMERADLQIGNIWTHPDHRCRGLAEFAIKQIIQTFDKPNRRFWYIVEKSNIVSINVIEKCHFHRFGEGTRSKRLNMRLLGSFVIQRCSDAECVPS